MKNCFRVVSAGIFLATLCSAQAQQTLVDWNHSWNYMHPTGGALPAGSGPTTPHPTGTTPWFAPQANFGTYTGPSFTTGGTGFEAGAGAGPLSYGVVDYTTTPDPAPAEFTTIGTTLISPTSGSRYTGYFRTTFSVPNDGNAYLNPVFRYILDDGGFVYLDGVLVLKVNVAAAAEDGYLVLASGFARTEAAIREASLNLAEGSSTGGNPAAATATPDNAIVVQRVSLLAPGVHTLAVSVHNASVTSSDLSLAVQLRATPCVLAGTATVSTRNTNGTPNDASDDSIGSTVTVTATGPSGAGWTVTGPAGSSLLGQTGSYGVAKSFPGIPLAEFASGLLAVEVADNAEPTCTTKVNLLPQRIIASDDQAGTNLPVVTTGTLPTGWVFDDVARSMTMRNGGGGPRKIVTSEVIALPGANAVGFSGTLEVVDTSSGTEADDSFVAYLVIDGNTANPINLITPYDNQVLDGVLSDNELAPIGGTVALPATTLYPLSRVIPGSANSVRIIIEGINNSGSETFNLRDFRLGPPHPTVQTTPGAVTFNNQGTVAPGDDRFSAPVTIESYGLGASTGWTSDATPASGLYAAVQPVLFGPFPTNESPKTIKLSDVGNVAVTSMFTLTLPATTFTVSAPTNIVRNENGAGIADDSVSFSVEVAGTFGGPGWTTGTPGISPGSGNMGTANLTIGGPLPAGPVAVVLSDASYPALTRTVTVVVPPRYVVGQTNLGAGAVDLLSDLAQVPAVQWVNDPALRTLTMTAGGATESVVTSQLIDLTAVGEVFFTATMRASETSTGSNFERLDRFKAELVYTIGGNPTTVNLVSPYDVGDGAPSTTGTGVNGAANGFINGYQGAAGTDQQDATVYANALADYNAHVARDEFNRLGEPGVNLIDNAFPLSATIPAAADNVRLIVTGASVGGSETVVVAGVLFSTTMGALDSDGDGMSDAYEDANGLDKFSPADKFLDLDGDGQSNFSESLAGTTANSASSVLKIVTITKSGMIANVSWNSVPGVTYRIDVSGSMATGAWTDLGADFPASGGPQTSSGPLDLTLIGNPLSQNLRVRVK